MHSPVKQPADCASLDIDTRTYNMLLRSLRGRGERGFALLAGSWGTLQRVTISPRKIGDIATASLVLTHFEDSYSSCSENLTVSVTLSRHATIEPTSASEPTAKSPSSWISFATANVVSCHPFAVVSVAPSPS